MWILYLSGLQIQSPRKWLKNMEYGQVTVDDGKNGRMTNNDPYDWSPKHNKPRYLIDLLLSVINVSI